MPFTRESQDTWLIFSLLSFSFSRKGAGMQRNLLVSEVLPQAGFSALETS